MLVLAREVSQLNADNDYTVLAKRTTMISIREHRDWCRSFLAIENLARSFAPSLEGLVGERAEDSPLRIPLPPATSITDL